MAQKKRTHKKLPKRKNQRTQSFFNKYFTIISAVLLSFFTGLIVGAYFYLGSDELAVDTKKEQIQKEQVQKKELSYEEKTQALNIEYDDSNAVTEEVAQKTKKEQPIFHYEEPDYGKVDEVVKESEEVEEQKTFTQKIIPTVKEKIKSVFPSKDMFKESGKPKLAIIIDDVTSSHQLRKIKQIGYPVNVALLPPTNRHPNSAKIAQSLDRYMVHLPLQASSSRYEEENTLYIYDDIETMDTRIQSIKKLYPKAKFINNHTGSKFTADYEAMDKLLQVLKKHGFYFVDSRTTAKSVAKSVAKKHDLKMLSRNIFLDNKKETAYIQNQLKQAIAKAKKHGTAIAIGHPFNITFNTLKASKELLKDIELVYIEQL